MEKSSGYVVNNIKYRVIKIYEHISDIVHIDFR